MKALILAGGLGTRLREIIIDKPKAMAPIDNKPFLEYLIKLIKKQGINEIIISVGYLPDTVINYFGDGERFGVRIYYSDEKFPLGTGGAIKNAEKFFSETFLVLNGDTYLDFNLSDLVKFQRLKQSKALIIVNKPSNHSAYGSILLDKTKKIISFEEKKENKRSWVNSGYYILEPEIFNYIPKGKRVSLEKEIFPTLLKKGLNIYGYPTLNKYLDIGTPRGYKIVNLILPKLLYKRKIIAKAPLRISFIGGGTDIPEFFQRYRGCVLSSAIDKYVRVQIKPRQKNFLINLKDFNLYKEFIVNKPLECSDDRFKIPLAVIKKINLKSGVEITIESDLPSSSGMGTSSATTVALIKGLSFFRGDELDKKKIAEMAVEIERKELALPGGLQDQYSCAFGGINYVQFLENNDVIVQSLGLSKEVVKKLLNMLMLLYIPRNKTNKEMQKSLILNIKTNKESVTALKNLKKLVFEAENCLLNNHLEEFGKILGRSFDLKIKSNPNILISNPTIMEMYNFAIKNGGLGGKLLGAGSGGFMLIAAKADKIAELRAKFESKGYLSYSFSFNFEGVQSRYED